MNLSLIQHFTTKAVGRYAQVELSASQESATMTLAYAMWAIALLVLSFR